VGGVTASGSRAAASGSLRRCPVGDVAEQTSEPRAEQERIERDVALVERG
jgi:hypothetical protein